MLALRDLIIFGLAFFFSFFISPLLLMLMLHVDYTSFDTTLAIKQSNAQWPLTPFPSATAKPAQRLQCWRKSQSLHRSRSARVRDLIWLSPGESRQILANGWTRMDPRDVRIGRQG